VSGAIPPLPNTPSLRGVQLKKKHRDNFTKYYGDESKEDEIGEAYSARGKNEKCIQNFQF
jgi:hypothetical protein